VYILCALVGILKKKFEMYFLLSELSELIMDPSVQFYHLSCNIGSFFIEILILIFQVNMVPRGPRGFVSHLDFGVAGNLHQE
jgi:hypothetical protein